MVNTADLVVRVITETDDSTSRLKKYASQFKTVGGAVKAAAVPAAAALVALGAAAISAGNAAADDAQAAALLANTLKKSAGATDAQVASTETYIDKLARATGVADDQLRPAMATLAMGTKDVTKAQEALGVALDVSAATGQDVETVSKAIAKAYAGNTGSLARLVPSLDKATLASGDMNAIMKEMADQTGGAAAAAADTAAGKMDRMKVAMGEAQEEIGSALLPVMASLATVAGNLAVAIQNHPNLFRAVAVAIGVLALAIMAANVAMTIAAIAEAAMLWPILLIVVAIAALVVVIILLVKHFDQIKAVGVATWEAIQKAAGSVADGVKAAWQATWTWLSNAARAVGNAVTAAWNTVRATMQAIATGVRNVWDTVFNAIGRAADSVKEAVVGAFRDAKQTVNAVLSGLGAVWSKPFDVVESAVRAVSSAVDAMIGWVKRVAPPAAFSAPFDTALTVINKVIGAVQSLISWLGKIHVPKIHLPHIPGTRAAPAAAMPSVAGYAAPRGVATSGGRATTTGAVVINVTGALDPEAVARQIQRIMGGHNRRIGLSLT